MKLESAIARIALPCVACCAGWSLATAAGFPERPVRMIVPFAAGGGSDILSRAIGQKLTEGWGQQVVIDNRPDAGRNIGMEVGARASPDGHNLVMAYTGTIAINPSMYPKLPYDPVRDFAPITQVASAPMLLVVNPAVPAKSVKELIAYAKAHPRQLNYASAGNGTTPHLNGELFKSMAGVDMVHIPYKGGIGGQVITDLLSGRVQVYFVNMLAGIPHAKAGRLRGLAVTSSRRSPAMPEIPTLSEAGVPGYEALNWYGVLAPAGTPAPVVTRLNADFVRVLSAPEVKDRLAGEGAEAVGDTPAQFAAFIRTEIAKWSRLIKDAGIRPD